MAPGAEVYGYTMKLDKDFVELLIPRKTQIFAAEAIAALVAPLLTEQHFARQDVVWFVDNEAAMSSLIRGPSRSGDVGHIAGAASLLALQNHTRCVMSGSIRPATRRTG